AGHHPRSGTTAFHPGYRNMVAVAGMAPLFGPRRFVRAGATLMDAGSHSECLLVDTGLASARFGEDDVEVGLIGPGGIINVGALFGTDHILHSVVAATDCLVW